MLHRFAYLLYVFNNNLINASIEVVSYYLPLYFKFHWIKNTSMLSVVIVRGYCVTLHSDAFQESLNQTTSELSGLTLELTDYLYQCAVMPISMDVFWQAHYLRGKSILLGNLEGNMFLQSLLTNKFTIHDGSFGIGLCFNKPCEWSRITLSCHECVSLY